MIGDMLKVCGFPGEFRETWEQVIEKCTMYSPEDRYKSYKIMKKDIAEIWQIYRAMLMAQLGHLGRALKTVVFGEKKKDGIKDDFLVM